MTRGTIFLLTAIVLFLLAALSAFMDSVNLNEVGLGMLAGAAFVAAHLADPGARP